jgi:Rrf2 family protein
MQISKKADYALRAMAMLAAIPPERSLQAQALAEAGRIPIKFLEQILLALKKAGLLHSKRGAGGGYRLERPSRLISVADVIEAVDGELVRLVTSPDYLDFPGASGLGQCLTEAEDLINGAWQRTTLEDLVRLEGGDAMAGSGI